MRTRAKRTTGKQGLRYTPSPFLKIGKSLPRVGGAPPRLCCPGRRGRTQRMRCMHLCACACMGIEIVTKPDFQDILIIYRRSVLCTSVPALSWGQYLYPGLRCSFSEAGPGRAAARGRATCAAAPRACVVRDAVACGTAAQVPARGVARTRASVRGGGCGGAAAAAHAMGARAARARARARACAGRAAAAVAVMLLLVLHRVSRMRDGAGARGACRRRPCARLRRRWRCSRRAKRMSGQRAWICWWDLPAISISTNTNTNTNTKYTCDTGQTRNNNNREYEFQTEAAFR